MRSPIKGALANPLVKQLRREDRRGSARLARKKFRACALLALTLVHHLWVYWLTDSFQCPWNYGQSAPTFCCGLVDNNNQ